METIAMLRRRKLSIKRGGVSAQFGLALRELRRGVNANGSEPPLSAEIKRAQAAGDPDTGETHYRHWLAALERVVAVKGVTTSETLHRYRDAWDHAADRTPHGAPIELRPEDFAS